MGLLDAIKITAKFVENSIKYAVNSKEERFISYDAECKSIPEELCHELDSIDDSEIDIE